MTTDHHIVDLVSRVLAVTGHRVVRTRRMVDGEVAAWDFVIVDEDGDPVASCPSPADLILEGRDIVLESLERTGARRYVAAIDEGDIEREEFLELTERDGEGWLERGESALLSASLPRTSVQPGPTRL